MKNIISANEKKVSFHTFFSFFHKSESYFMSRVSNAETLLAIINFYFVIKLSIFIAQEKKVSITFKERSVIRF